MAAADYSDDASPTAEPGSDQAILEELRERFDYAVTQKARIVEQGDLDVAFNAGHTWNQDDQAARAGRPCLELDQLSQYTNQLVNSYRQNPRGIKVSPGGGGATDKTAELTANRVRQIEYDSHAQEVYTVAGENGATRGYGYARIVAVYEDATSANQALRLKAIPNPNQVVEDPDGESTSGADWQYLFFIHTITIREFRRDYPDATIKDFDTTTLALAPRWFGKDGRVQIAEYWYVTETANPQGRPTRTVCMYLTNGVELLQKRGSPKKTEWKGSSIPFIACYGKIVYSTGVQSDSQTGVPGETEKTLQSYTRLARDGAKGYNWTASTELEALALPVKAALFAYEGQLSPDQVALVERSTREPIALITAKATTEATGQTVLPLPQYGTRAPDIQGYEIARESFRRDIQNALGHFSSNDARQGSTKVISGAALDELRKSGDLGSYHFVAHYDDMVREGGVKLVELLPFYDDAEGKEVATRLPDGTTKLVTINKRTGRAPDGTPAYGPDDLRMDPAHRHTVTISTGPSRDSQRAEGKDAAMALLANPAAFPVIAADAVRLMDLGAVGDQMAEDLEFIQPPVMQQARQQKQQGNAPDPRQLQQELGQLKEQVQHAEQVMQAMDGELKGKQAEIASKERIAQAEIASKEKIADEDSRRRAETAITVAEISSKDKDAALYYEERARIGVLEEAAVARAHEFAMHREQLAHAADLAAAAGQNKLDAAAQAARKVTVHKTITRSPEGQVLGMREEHVPDDGTAPGVQ